jgi:dipeptidase D
VRDVDSQAFVQFVAEFEQALQAEFAGIEESLTVAVASTERPTTMIGRGVQAQLIRAVVGCPDGLQRMSLAMEGLVQTSTNLARVVSDGKQIHLQALLRSSVNSEKEALGDTMAAMFELAGAKVELSGSYDGWNPNMNSPILKTMVASYEQLYGKRPAVMAIHAGLECGVIGGTYPHLDMISFGPTICYPHSPDERVNIASVGKFYEFLLHTLKHIPLK